MSDTDNSAARRVALIEDKLDAEALAKVALATERGQVAGIRFTSMLEAMQCAKMMAISGVAVPPYLRGNAGACLAIVMRANVLGIEPFALANWSYEVENKGVKRVAYESAFYHAMLELRAPIRGGLKHEIIGEGDDRVCRVWAVRADTGEVIEHKSGKLGELRPKRNDYGQIKGSPLWDRKPEVQLFYDTSRDFTRIHFPHILSGLPTVDEILDAEGDHVGPHKAKDVTPGLVERLRLKNSAPTGDKPEGFADKSLHSHIASQIAAATVTDDTPDEQADGGKRKRKTTTINEKATEIADAVAHGTADAMAAADAQGGSSLPVASGNPSPSAAVQKDSVAASPPATDSEPATVNASSVAGDATNSAENPPASVPADSKPAASPPPDAAGDAIEKAPTMLARERGIADRKAGKKRRDVPEDYRATTRAAEALAWDEGWQAGGRSNA